MGAGMEYNPRGGGGGGSSGGKRMSLGMRPSMSMGGYPRSVVSSRIGVGGPGGGQYDVHGGGGHGNLSIRTHAGMPGHHRGMRMGPPGLGPSPAASPASSPREEDFTRRYSSFSSSFGSGQRHSARPFSSSSSSSSSASLGFCEAASILVGGFFDGK